MKSGLRRRKVGVSSASHEEKVQRRRIEKKAKDKLIKVLIMRNRNFGTKNKIYFPSKSKVVI